MTLEAAPATPAAPLEPGPESTPPAATPPAEPAPPPAPEPTPDQSTAEADARLAQAEYTRGQQAYAELKRELGLEGKVTREQILEAVRALRTPAGDAEPGEPLSEREQELATRAFAAELRVQEAINEPIYGKGFGQRTLDFVNTVRQTNDPEAIFEAAAAYIEATRPTPSEPAPAGAPATPVPPPDTGLPEGDQPPSARTSPAAGRRRESGVVGAVRGIFREAGIGPAQR